MGESVWQVTSIFVTAPQETALRESLPLGKKKKKIQMENIIKSKNDYGTLTSSTIGGKGLLNQKESVKA